MKLCWKWQYLDNEGTPTFGFGHWKAKCLSFEWDDNVIFLFVGEVFSARERREPDDSED